MAWRTDDARSDHDRGRSALSACYIVKNAPDVPDQEVPCDLRVTAADSPAGTTRRSTFWRVTSSADRSRPVGCESDHASYLEAESGQWLGQTAAPGMDAYLCQGVNEICLLGPQARTRRWARETGEPLGITDGRVSGRFIYGIRLRQR